MPETQPSIFDETDVFMLPPRRALLPWWIIFFSWFLIIICIVQVIMMTLDYFGITKLGIITEADSSFKNIFSLANSFFTIVAAYGLLREKDWAVNIAILNALASVAQTFFSTNEVFADTTEAVIFWSIYGVGLIMLAIYLWKLFSIRKDWNIRRPR